MSEPKRSLTNDIILLGLRGGIRAIVPVGGDIAVDLFDIVAKRYDPTKTKQFFSDIKRTIQADRGTYIYPPINFCDEGDQYNLSVQWPGVLVDDISLSITGLSLTISGERRLTKTQENVYRRQERMHGRSTRTLTLPDFVESSQASASYIDGILKVTLPKINKQHFPPNHTNRVVVSQDAITPPIDISEETDALVVEIDLPGVPKNDIIIHNCENNVLSLHGKIPSFFYTNTRILHKEFPMANFYRSFILSDEVDQAEITASSFNGVLSVILPKAERIKTKKIKIN